LQIARWQGSKLELAHALRGFSNHKIGAREQNLSATVKADDHALPYVIVPSNNRRVLHMVGYKDGKIVESLGQKALTAPVARHIPGAQTEADCAAFDLKTASGHKCARAISTLGDTWKPKQFRGSIHAACRSLQGYSLAAKDLT
jgi:hypothetical protein